MARWRRRDKGLEAAGDFAAEAGVAALFEFPPVAIAVGVIAGVGFLGFLVWKSLSQRRDR